MMSHDDRVQPYAKNAFYWQYKGQPVLLLGGSVEDNLIQIPQLEAHLNLMQKVGANYVRCTLSSRDAGDDWPFERDLETGLYDLTRPGSAYWGKFSRFLEMTAARDIFVQIEVWDRFDFARAPWRDNPYNPINNLNYTEEESGLKTAIDTHPSFKESNFFRSVPALENNTLLLEYQHRHVDKMLEIALPYGHVFYCMDNETNESPEWGAYWARYIRSKAEAAGVTVPLTEMWDAHNLLDDMHKATLDHPETYDFVDISQNNHQPAKEHWENAQGLRQYIIDSGNIRPMNNVKIYGANTGAYGSHRDAQERLWRNIFGGLASSRFHRPPAGMGLSTAARRHITSLRLLTAELDIFNCVPHNDLLQNRSWNEAYCTANPGLEYAVMFPDGGDILLDIGDSDQPLSLRWLDILNTCWLDTAQTVPTSDPRRDGSTLRLCTPRESGFWAAYVKLE